MKTKSLLVKSLMGVMAAVLLIGSISTSVSADALNRGRNPNSPSTKPDWAGNGIGTGGGSAISPLTDAEKNGLQDAIKEEYGAMTFYQAVILKFGDIAPFSWIMQSEQQHANVLIRQAEKYGVAIPEIPALPDVSNLNTIEEACAAGVAAEIADADLYDELNKVTTHTDLLRVYTNLQSASLNNHLPAFEACN